MASHDDLYKCLGKLQGVVESGFESTHKRLDALNGKVAQHVLDISRLEKEDIRQQNQIDKITERNEKSDKIKWTVFDKILGLVFGVALVVFLVLLKLQ